jgi:hypothetical protein
MPGTVLDALGKKAHPILSTALSQTYHSLQLADHSSEDSQMLTNCPKDLLEVVDLGFEPSS